jgi:ATP-dependent DNA ligase
MKFSELTQYFEKLEDTSSRLTLIEILSELFKKTPESEVEIIVYLIQGRLAPFFVPIEIGMAEKTVAQSLANAYETSKDEVIKTFNKLGDMGKTAEKLALEHKLKSSNLTVNEVFIILTEIANTKGEGTVDKRQTLLSNLLKELDPISAKHLVRIPLGNTRLGIGDPTVLDALATAKLGDKSKRKLLEGAYNRTSDLGLIAKTLWIHGLKGVEKLEVRVGSPIRSELCERLPNPQKVIEKMTEVDAQYKYDGFRCIGGYTPIYTKRKGITMARDLQIGDEVLTERGRFKKVLAKQKRAIRRKERLFLFKTYLGEEIKISEGHPVLALVDGKEQWRLIENIESGDEVIFPLPYFHADNPHPAPKKLELQTISGYKKTFLLNDNFYRFMGFWIGDGFTNDFHNTERVGLTFNNKTEVKLAGEYEKIVKNTLQISAISRYVHNGGLNLYWRDEPLKHWLSTYFRREWKGKMLPEWFSHITKKQFTAFLTGWIESDGYTDKDGFTKIITKERDLAAFAQLIALSFGIIIGLRYIRIKNKTYYSLLIPKTHNKARIIGQKIYVKVLRNIEFRNRDSRTQLYDIQIEEDESFCIPMATLHNCQIHKNRNEVRMFSRNLEEMTHMFPELIEATKKQVRAETVILDSEALAYNPDSEEFLPFQETTKRRRKHGIEEMAKSLPLKAFVFDILYKNGKSLIDEPLYKRMEILKQTLEDDGVLIRTKNQTIKDPKILGILLEDAISKGLEGLVVKKLESPYVAGGRNFNWVKLKRHSSGELNDTIDCVILGYITGKGKRTAFGAGALLVGLYDSEKDEFVTTSKIGTGLTDEEWREVHKRADKIKVDHKPARVNSQIVPSVWIKPEIVIEVLADEITRSPIHTAGKTETEPGYALRFPRLVSFRGSDKKAEDSTSVKELIGMYKQQGK